MKNTKFHFFMPVEILMADEGKLDLSEELKGNSVIIVTDPFLYESGQALALGQSITRAKVSYFHHIEPNPSTDTVDACAAAIRKAKGTTVIGLGGGSCLDTAKAAACMAASDKKFVECLAGRAELPGREPKLILIPTTAGTGSEVTNVGVYTNSETGEKSPMVRPDFYGDVAVIYPEATYTMPPAVTANTGMDAFCHAIEAYWNHNSQPLCDACAVGALKLIKENLLTAYNHPDDHEARKNMCVASLLAGVAFSQTRTTGPHALSYPLTARYHVAHGVGCAISLPAFIRRSSQKAEHKMRRLAKDLGYVSIESLADGVEELLKNLHMPTRLKEIGTGEQEMENIVKEAMNYYPQLALTPVVITEETLSELLHSIY